MQNTKNFHFLGDQSSASSAYDCTQETPGPMEEILLTKSQDRMGRDQGNNSKIVRFSNFCI